MTALESLALESANRLHCVLGQLCELPQNGRGSCAEQAWNLMDLVIWYLDPNGPEDGIVWKRPESASEPRSRDAGEIRLMLEAGVSISDCASYYGASETAVRHLLGEVRP